MTDTSIKLRRSAVEGKVPTDAQLELGEVAINTYDGKMFFKKQAESNAILEVATTTNNLGQFSATTSSQLSSIITDETGSGNLVFNTGATLFAPTISGNTNFDSGTLFIDSTNDRVGVNTTAPSTALDVRGTISTNNASITGSLSANGSVGTAGQVLRSDGSKAYWDSAISAAQNVLYVSKSGNDSNGGTDLSSAKLTLASAVTAANALQAANPSGVTVIMVKAGDYTEANPISLSAGVSIVGDNLRSVTVRPANTTQDILWVRNRCYVTGITFRDHLTPAAAIAYPSTGAGPITTSPYVQNCSSITTTGAGMRVDGSLASGLRSMVLDSYTQFNQGGLGIHITNGGYAQLVSIFTICCSAGIKCENGGTCSITNSNCSFGDYGLWAEGVGDVLYSGSLVSSTRSTLTVSGLSVRPAVNDVVEVTDGVSTQYLLVRSATALSSGTSTITFAETLGFTPITGTVDFRQVSLISASGHTFEYVGTGTDLLTSTPRLGGVPIQENEIRQTNGGRVNFTSTDQFGDFRIGGGLTINEEAGVIQGVTFDRSLFAVLTPFILALEG